MNKIIIALIGFAGLHGFVNGQTTSYSDTVGYLQKTFPSGTSAHGVGFVLAEKFRGVASSKSGDVLTISSSPFTSNQFAPVGGLPSHYILLTSGAQAGLVADIVSNTTSSVTVGSGDLSGVSYSPSFVIRPHLKASFLFANSSGLEDYADTLNIFNSDGTTTSLLRDSTAATGWVNAASLSAIDAVIYPGQGYLLNTTSGGSFTTSGVVSPDSVSIPVYAGLVNLVSGSDPSSSVQLQTSGIGTNLEIFADTVGMFSGDGNLTQIGNYLWAGASDGGFVDPASLAPVTGVNFAGTEAVIVNSTFDTVWKIKSPLTP